jgi:hypothetical protein
VPATSVIVSVTAGSGWVLAMNGTLEVGIHSSASQLATAVLSRPGRIRGWTGSPESGGAEPVAGGSASKILLLADSGCRSRLADQAANRQLQTPPAAARRPSTLRRARSAT